jgi:hypothetical protein
MAPAISGSMWPGLSRAFRICCRWLGRDTPPPAILCEEAKPWCDSNRMIYSKTSTLCTAAPDGLCPPLPNLSRDGASGLRWRLSMGRVFQSPPKDKGFVASLQYDMAPSACHIETGLFWHGAIFCKYTDFLSESKYCENEPTLYSDSSRRQPVPIFPEIAWITRPTSLGCAFSFPIHFRMGFFSY